MKIRKKLFLGGLATFVVIDGLVLLGAVPAAIAFWDDVNAAKQVWTEGMVK